MFDEFKKLLVENPPEVDGRTSNLDSCDDLLLLFCNNIYIDYPVPGIPVTSNDESATKTLHHDQLAIKAYSNLSLGNVTFGIVPTVEGSLYVVDKKTVSGVEGRVFLFVFAEFLQRQLKPESIIYAEGGLAIRGFDSDLCDRVLKIAKSTLNQRYQTALRQYRKEDSSPKHTSPSVLLSSTDQKKKTALSGKARIEYKFEQFIQQFQARLAELTRSQQKEKRKAVPTINSQESNTTSQATVNSSEELDRYSDDLAQPTSNSLRETLSAAAALISSSTSSSSFVSSTSSQSSSTTVIMRALVHDDRNIGGIQLPKKELSPPTPRREKQEDKDKSGGKKTKQQSIVDALLKVLAHHRQILEVELSANTDIQVTNQPLARLLQTSTLKQPLTIIIHHHMILMNLRQFFIGLMLYPGHEKDSHWEEFHLKLVHGCWDLSSLVKLSKIIETTFKSNGDSLILPNHVEMLFFQGQVFEIVNHIPRLTSAAACWQIICEEIDCIAQVGEKIFGDRTMLRQFFSSQQNRFVRESNMNSEHSRFHIDRIDCILQSLVQLGEAYQALERFASHQHKTPQDYFPAIKNLEFFLTKCKQEVRNLACHDVIIDEESRRQYLQGFLRTEDFIDLYYRSLNFAKNSLITQNVLQQSADATRKAVASYDQNNNNNSLTM